MQSALTTRLLDMFDALIMQNTLRGLYVEAMVAESLGDRWRHTGSDWAGWDLEHDSGLRVEVKQSARLQSWGPAQTSPRFSISTPKGYYPDGKTFVENTSGERLADAYVFAWHEGNDQRLPEQWQFYVIRSSALPQGQSSIGLKKIKDTGTEATAENLKTVLQELLRKPRETGI